MCGSVKNKTCYYFLDQEMCNKRYIIFPMEQLHFVTLCQGMAENTRRLLINVKSPEQTMLPTVTKFSVSESCYKTLQYCWTRTWESGPFSYFLCICMDKLLSMKTCEMFVQKSGRFFKLLWCQVHLPTKVLRELKLRTITKNRKYCKIKKQKTGKSFNSQRLAWLGFGVQMTEFDRRERISDHLN